MLGPLFGPDIQRKQIRMKSLMEHGGLLHAVQIRADGSSTPIALDEIPGKKTGYEYHWIHMCASHPDTRQYLEEHAKLDALVVDALLAIDTRPRVLDRKEGTMLVLRAMNFMPGGKAEDMISLRVWIADGCVITTRLRDILAIEDLKAMAAANNAPKRIGAFVTAITDRVYSRMEPVIDQLEDDTAQLEETIDEKGNTSDETAPLRIKNAILRRHILPQHAALTKLIKTKPGWLQEDDIEQLTESDDQITRYVESLNDIRDRLVIINDEIASQNDRRMASTNYLFTLAATIFLPLTFITGLLGVNIGGIPGVDNPQSFGILIGFCVIVAAIQVWIFKRRGWF